MHEPERRMASAHVEHAIARRGIRADREPATVRGPELHGDQMNALVDGAHDLARLVEHLNRARERVAMVRELVDPFFQEQAGALVPRALTATLRAEGDGGVDAEAERFEKMLAIAHAHVERLDPRRPQRTPGALDARERCAHRAREVVAVTAR